MAVDGALVLVGLTVVIGFGFLLFVFILAGAAFAYLYHSTSSSHAASAADAGHTAGGMIPIAESPLAQHIFAKPRPTAARPSSTAQINVEPPQPSSWPQAPLGGAWQMPQARGTASGSASAVSPAIPKPKPMPRMQGTLDEADELPSTCSIVEVQESPEPSAHITFTNARLPSSRPEAACPTTTQAVQHGYAAQLVHLFGGTLASQCENVSIVVHSFDLGTEDLCYCSLCLEHITSVAGASFLCKTHGIGPLSARVWAVVLARFVFEVQGWHNVVKEEHLEVPCKAWQYDQTTFAKEVSSCEDEFKLKHGMLLMSAFQHPQLRSDELQRTRARLSQGKPQLHRPCCSARCPLRQAKLANQGLSVPDAAQNRARGKRQPAAVADAPRRKALTDVEKPKPLMDRSNVTQAAGGAGKRLAIAAEPTVPQGVKRRKKATA